jgi:hypothetical protein
MKELCFNLKVRASIEFDSSSLLQNILSFILYIQLNIMRKQGSDDKSKPLKKINANQLK